MADDQHDDDRDDAGGDDPPTRAELAQLNQRFDDLSSAIDDLRSSSTPADRREARDDADDAEDAFTRAAKAAGLDRAAIVRAVQAAKDEQGFDQFKRFMDRLEHERAAAADEQPAKPKPRARRPSSSSSSAPDNGRQEDSAPVKPHWTERSLNELLR